MTIKKYNAEDCVMTFTDPETGKRTEMVGVTIPMPPGVGVVGYTDADLPVEVERDSGLSLLPEPFHEWTDDDGVVHKIRTVADYETYLDYKPKLKGEKFDQVIIDDAKEGL